MNYVIKITDRIIRQVTGGELMVGQYLRGPCTPAKVEKHGYGFTKDKAQAWPFPSVAQAWAKADIVARHMSWGAPRFVDLEEVE